MTERPLLLPRHLETLSPVWSPVLDEITGGLLSGSPVLQPGADALLLVLRAAHWPEPVVRGVGNDEGCVDGKVRECHCLSHICCVL